MDVLSLILVGLLTTGPILAVFYATRKVNDQLIEIHGLVNERLTAALNEIITLRKEIVKRDDIIRDLESH